MTNTEPLRNKSGDLVHVCNGDNRSGLPFGRKAEPGVCPRCDEMRSGAPARERFGGRLTRAQRDEQESADLRAHFASSRHRNGECGLVCTFGQW